MSKSQDNITDERLSKKIILLKRELDDYYKEKDRPISRVEDLEIYKELQTLRQAIKQQGSILDSREELIIKLIEDAEGLAKRLHREIYGHHHSNKVSMKLGCEEVRRHKELMESIEKPE